MSVASRRSNRCGRSIRGSLVAWAAIAWLSPASLGAQAPADARAVIVGQVRVASGRPIPGAVIRSDDDTAGTTSDEIGRFRLLSRQGQRFLRVRAMGYQPVDTIVAVTGDRVLVGIVMSRLAVQLDSIRVTATGTQIPARYTHTMKYDAFYEHRRAAIGGTFFTREDVDAAEGADFYTLLGKVPGVRVQRSAAGGESVRFERCPSVGAGGSQAVQLFVDGTRVGSALATLETMKPKDVEAIEVYQGTAQLPMEARGDGCAAIFVWTRYTTRADEDKHP